jgi:protein O-mannosyl-transferase
MMMTFREKMRPHWIPLSILVLMTFAVYMRILGHDFQLFWDDEKYVTANETIRGFTLQHLRGAFTTNYMGNYAPLHIISYMIDYSLWGLNPQGYFLTNIMLHICNGILFYVILIRLEWSRAWAFISAFVFLLHPVQVESVAWVSERKNLLAMAFFLLAVISYLAFRNNGLEKGKRFYVFSLVFFFFALLTKSEAIIFPLMLILYDICFLEKGTGRGRWADKLPFLSVAAVMAWVTIQSQMPGEMPGVGGGRVPWHGGSPIATFLTMLTVLPCYLKLLFWPTGLSAVYAPAIRTGFDGEVLGGGFLAIMLAIAGALLFRRNRRLFFWYGSFFIALLPVAQIVPITTLMNDRYLYFPMLGAAACAGSLAFIMENSLGWRRVPGFLTAGVILTVLPCITFARTGIWKNDLSLWSDAAKKSPGHYLALYGLAQALQNSGDLDAALPIYLRIHELNPRHLDTLTHLGALYRARNMPLAGRPYLKDVTRYYPNLAVGFTDLGVNFYQTDELVEAETAFRRALEIDPRSRDAIHHMGMICLRTRRIDEARNYFRYIISLGDATADVEYNMACAEALGGHPDEALRHLESAFRLGFRERESIAKDPDLDSIRSLPGFLRMVRNYYGEMR